MNEPFRPRLAIVALAATVALCGCGLPGAPQAPSLNLPRKVADLTAARAGNQVALHWTMPSRNTDSTLMKGPVEAQICRRDEAVGPCAFTGTLQLAPGANGIATQVMPAPLATGSPRAVTYFIELKNSRGRSAGLSNGATVLAGQAPSPVTGLTAEMARDGVVLHWDELPPGRQAGATEVRLQRTLVSSAAPRPARGELIAPPPEPGVQNLLVPEGATAGGALDKSIRFGEVYEYRAQRVLRETVNGQTLELTSELSLPVRIHVLNTFPPSVPTGLVAVATPAENGAPTSVDLSWQPDSEPISGYVVYRRQSGQQWQRISPPQPVVGPAFRDQHAEPGQSYEYAVSAVGSNGLESARSAETQETVPSP